MVLRRISLLATSLTLLALALPAARAAEEGPRTAQVTLELKDYLSLVQSAERAERERKQQAANRTEPLAEVSSQTTRILVRDGVADVTADLEVLVQGHPKANLLLPVNLIADKGTVERQPGTGASAAASGPTGRPGAALNGSKGQVYLVPTEPGRYSVRLTGASRLSQGGGRSRYTFAPVAAPVAVAEVDLAADLAWSAPGAVVVDERVEGARRKVRISARRGERPVFEVRRKVDSGDAEKLLARAVVLTLLQLGPEGAQRHDVLFYEVSRGSLASFTVDLPPGLAVERVGTDEGEMVPLAEARRLTLHRRRQLQGSGFLVLTSTPDPSGALTLAPLQPGIEVRARYLAVASTIATEAQPLPEDDWSRVDLEDLPPQVGQALADLNPTAAWRLTEKGSQAEEAAALELRVVRVQPAKLLPAVVRSRETTTVVTVDGTVLHRDRLTLYPVSGIAAALDLVLPAGGTLWSVKVDDQALRPAERGGTVTVPLGFNEGKEPVVEVISVLAKAIPPGRSELALDLPRIAAPVQDHQWRLLLPAGASYRFAGGDLRPVPRLPAKGQGRPPVRVRQSSAANAPATGGNESVAVGSLYGTVRDPQGSELPGVTVTLEGVGAPQVQVTDAGGKFRFLNLPPNAVQLKWELEGFSTVETAGVAIKAARNIELETVLTPSVEDVITVTAEAEGGQDEGPIARRRREGWRKDKAPQPEGKQEVWAGDGMVITDMTAISSSPTYYDFDSFEEMQTTIADLKSGLVGGVRSLPVTIPENGKVFLMAGLLPPERVAVALEVRGQR